MNLKSIASSLILVLFVVSFSEAQPTITLREFSDGRPMGSCVAVVQFGDTGNDNELRDYEAVAKEPKVEDPAKSYGRAYGELLPGEWEYFARSNAQHVRANGAVVGRAKHSWEYHRPVGKVFAACDIQLTIPVGRAFDEPISAAVELGKWKVVATHVFSPVGHVGKHMAHVKTFKNDQQVSEEFLPFDNGECDLPLFMLATDVVNGSTFGVGVVTSLNLDQGGNYDCDAFVNLKLSSRVPADADGDEDVDNDDLIQLLGNYGSNSQDGPSAGDFNEDGKVDFADYMIYSKHVGIGFRP